MIFRHLLPHPSGVITKRKILTPDFRKTLADESAALIAEDAAFAARHRMKFMNQDFALSIRETEHNRNKPGCPVQFCEKLHSVSPAQLACEK